ncbi:HlyD family secretion protein [Bartonella sp. DGB2]|uniref:HlyD family secretion protein n=1 Tax=Bartonella sp. DGB2 TaxID=3388426 RepID=UPI00398FF340
MSETTSLPPHVPQSSSQKSSLRKNIFYTILFLLLITIGWYGFHWWTTDRFMISTDDSYIQGDIATIAPKLNGYIESIPVTANQAVKAGDILFKLEDKDYQIAYQQAQARLDTQEKTIQRFEAQITAARTSLDEAISQKKAIDAAAKNAFAILERTKKLNAGNFAPQSTVDNAQTAYDQAQANITSAQARIAAARANIAVVEAQRKEANSQTRILELDRDKAKNALDHTLIRAPFDGIIANISAKLGNFVTNGQRLAALIPNNNLYIEANYKETQLSNLRPGQPVYITIDGVKGRHYTGKVLSIAPASTALFSIIPAQNATGNFTKIVQRVPVRIALPSEVLSDGQARAGMSAEVTIDTKPQ